MFATFHAHGSFKYFKEIVPENEHDGYRSALSDVVMGVRRDTDSFADSFAAWEKLKPQERANVRWDAATDAEKLLKCEGKAAFPGDDAMLNVHLRKECQDGSFDDTAVVEDAWVLRRTEDKMKLCSDKDPRAKVNGELRQECSDIKLMWDEVPPGIRASFCESHKGNDLVESNDFLKQECSKSKVDLACDGDQRSWDCHMEKYHLFSRDNCDGWFSWFSNPSECTNQKLKDELWDGAPMYRRKNLCASRNLAAYKDGVYREDCPMDER